MYYTLLLYYAISLFFSLSLSLSLSIYVYIYIYIYIYIYLVEHESLAAWIPVAPFRGIGAGPFIPAPMPKPVCRTSSNNKWVQYEVCITYIYIYIHTYIYILRFIIVIMIIIIIIMIGQGYGNGYHSSALLFPEALRSRPSCRVAACWRSPHLSAPAKRVLSPTGI